MKKVLIILAIVLLFAIQAEAKTDVCLWVWNVDPGAATADPPDEVHCSLNGAPYKSMGETYNQNALGAKEITYTVDTVVADGTTTSADLVSSGTSTAIPNNVNVQDVRFLGSAECGTFDAGGVFYYTEEDHGVDDTQTRSLTPVSCIKLQLGTSTDTGVGGGVVWTTTHW